MSCPVCLEDFKDPVVLPCGHSLCHDTCSLRLIKNQTITCPKCRATHWIPDGEKLPRNYDLVNIIEDKTSQEPSPRCISHPTDHVTMFCTQCSVPVCVKCYVDFVSMSGVAESPTHKDHQVIPIDKIDTYVQDLVLVTSKYLKYKKDEEMMYLEQLVETEETLKDVMENKCVLIKNKTERLKQILDENSRRHIESLKTTLIQPEISVNSDQSLLRLQIYSNLLDQCHQLSRSDTSNNSHDIRRFLESLDNIPDCDLRPDPRCYINECITVSSVTNVSETATTGGQCYQNTQTGIPSAPVIEVEDCVVGNESISVTWLYTPTDNVGYFTVYYQTAIFGHGMCSDKTSIIVTDFGRSSGHVTVRDLQAKSRYKLCVTANNEFGESLRSDLLYFKVSSSNPEMELF